MVEKVSDQNRRVSRISGTRPESAPEPPGRQVYESAGARRPKAERPLDPLQSAADTAPADVRVHERCEGGRLDGKDRTPVNGNAPEALVAASFFDEFLQQNGELARDDPLACEALAGSFLERTAPGGELRMSHAQVAADPRKRASTLARAGTPSRSA